MTERVFLDTNIVVYAFDHAKASVEKRQKAQEILLNPDLELCLSAQVLSEFYVTVTRKLPKPLDPIDASRAITQLGELVTVPTDAGLVAAGIETSITHQLSYWDALIVEASVRAGCSRLLTEDLNAGATIRGVKIDNPFAGT
ncbi:PIN domain-containing protein [Tessaracoccus caeni]|uniref:PIN domain-containing protein n=1 Tax=Tessaracoccus caeni TaxID=3031239 RepID=UPI0023DA9AA1|nr:PIN domain-containing protein [Tessaracoccus caeni]MDF1489953.1 PIN domain-containing protein [Tessaracoccus caeni]